MKSLIQFIKESLQINENNLQNPEWLKHNKLYSNAVIDILTGNNESQTQLALGIKRAERFIDSKDISDETKYKLLKLKNTNGDYNTLVKQFNDYVGLYGSRLEQTFVSSPWRCMTFVEPAFSWRLSTFCVMTVTS